MSVDPVSARRHGIPAPRSHPKPPIFRRGITWIIGAAGTVVIATLTAISVGVAEKAASPAMPLIVTDYKGRSIDDIDNCGGVIAIGKTERDLGELPPPGDEDGPWRAFAERVHGLPGPPGGDGVGLVVQGSNQKSVVLTRLEIKVSRKPAPAGTWVVDYCGGDVEPRHLEVNLDTDPPRITYRPEGALGEGGTGTEKPERPIEFPYKVSENDPEVLRISARAENCDCYWTGVLHWVADGKKGATVINNSGKPFRVVGSAGLRTVNPPLR